MTMNDPSPGSEASWHPAEFLPEMRVDWVEHRNRLTVAFRLVLVIPQNVALQLLALGASVVAVVSWFSALVMGRLPGWAWRLQVAYLGYDTRVLAYLNLLVDRYPPFSLHAPEDYPVRIELHPGPLNRLTVLFRLLMVIPAGIVVVLLSAGWQVCALVLWLMILIKGRMPEPVFGATAAMKRYDLRVKAYLLMLTDAYPRGVFGDTPAPGPADSVRPLTLSQGGRRLVIVFLVAGVLNGVAGMTSGMSHSGELQQRMRQEQARGCTEVPLSFSLVPIVVPGVTALAPEVVRDILTPTWSHEICWR